MKIIVMGIAIALAGGAWIATYAFVQKILENMRVQDNMFAGLIQLLLALAVAVTVMIGVIKGAGF